MSDLVKSVTSLAVVACVGAVAAPRLLDAWSQKSVTSASPAARAMESSAPSASSQRASGYGSVVLQPGPGGHFHANVDIEGRRLPMMVDTGATIVALTQEDARAIGVNPLPSDYTVTLNTANGVAKGARVKLREVRIENISARDVEAVVLPRGVAGRSLLGMSFLNKLRGFEVIDGRMLLKA